MKIQALTSNDIPVLRDLAIRIYRDTFSDSNTPENMKLFLEKDYSVAAFQKEFEEKESFYFFALDGDVAAGYLRLRKSDEAEKYLGSNTIELHRLYIDKPYQGKKVGMLLMQHALNMATALKVEWIWLGVWEKNIRAQLFYKQWGFERFGEHVFQMGDEAQTDWLLKKKIT